MFSAPEAPSTEMPDSMGSFATPGTAVTRESKSRPLGRVWNISLVNVMPLAVLLTSIERRLADDGHLLLDGAELHGTSA